MKLDIGFNVLTLPFEVNTLTIGPSSQDIIILEVTTSDF